MNLTGGGQRLLWAGDWAGLALMVLRFLLAVMRSGLYVISIMVKLFSAFTLHKIQINQEVKFFRGF